MIDYNTQQKMIADAVKQFPETFGLRAYDGTFRIGLRQSYVNDSGTVMLYTQIQKDDKWLDFCKGTIRELQAEIVRK